MTTRDDGPDEPCVLGAGCYLDASPKPEQGTPKTTKQQYEESVVPGDNLSPLEALRFFCSLSMAGQDWLDVESLFDAVADALATEKAHNLKMSKLATPAAFTLDENKRLREELAVLNAKHTADLKVVFDEHEKDEQDWEAQVAAEKARADATQQDFERATEIIDVERKALAEVTSRADGLAADAARYRWLRGTYFSETPAAHLGRTDTPEQLDAAIDAALAQARDEGRKDV